MKAAAVLLLLAAAAPAAENGRRLLGVWGAWGAFADEAGCWAVALPQGRPRRGAAWRAQAAVGVWPAEPERQSLFVRLSRARDRSAGVTLSAGERRFRLAANGTDAWAPDAASNRAVLTAMRGARSMSVEAVGAGGRPFADAYRLDGAATAMDAAALACRGR